MLAKSIFTPDQEKEFLAWIRTLPSCLSGNTPCEPAHVRRVAFGSGTGLKPALFAVPLTHEEHAHQHQHGELAAIITHGQLRLIDASPQGAKDWFTEQALRYREKWLKRCA